MKLSELLLNRFMYKESQQSVETKDSVYNSGNITAETPAPLPSGGAAQDINTGNVTINGQQLTPGTIPPTTLDVSNWGWSQLCVFSSSTINTVDWGAGTFISADGNSYSISAGSTGIMVAKTYIYLSLLDSTTTYQITTTPANAVGIGKVLIAVASPSSVVGTLATYNLSEASQIVGDNILANSINASKMSVGQLSAISADLGTVNAGSINGVTIAIGSGNNIFKADTNGIYLGNSTFASAPFNVDMAGNAKVSSLARNDFHIFSAFESIDGYAQTPGAGTITCSGTGVDITTGGTANDTSSLQKDLQGGLTWDKNRKLKVCLSISQTTSQLIWIASGDASPSTDRHIGFYVANGTIYGDLANGTYQETLNCGSISGGSITILEWVLVAGTSVKYYIDGVYKGEITQNIPTGSLGSSLALNSIIQTTANAAKSISLYWWDFWQATA